MSLDDSRRARSKCGLRETGTYLAYAKEDSDTKKTDEFLQLKVQHGEPFYALPVFDNDEDIAAWFSLHLDPEAKAEVEKYEGIREVKDEPMMHFD
jgi:hypothetical protein